MPNIVTAQFENKYTPGQYSGSKYSYFVKDGIDLKVGDIVRVPTKYGESLVGIAETGLKESQIDERVMPFMKTIESGPVQKEQED